MRPSLPLTLLLALGMWAGIGICYPFLRTASTARCVLCIAVSLVVAGALTVALLSERGAALVLAVALGVAVGLVCAGASSLQMHRGQQLLVSHTGSTVVELVKDSRPGSFGTTLTGRAQVEGAESVQVQVNLSDDVSLMAGERIRVTALWRTPSDTRADTCWTQGVAAVANASSYQSVPVQGPGAAVRQVRRRAIDCMESGDGAGNAGMQFLEAVLLGWRVALFDSAWYAAAKIDGLAHMVAVSGAHLAIVCGITLALMGKLGMPRRVQWAAQVVLVVAYLVLTGVAVSAVRAAFMVVIGLSAFLARRRPYSLGALSLAILVMLALDPHCAFSLSFALSAGSTLGIVLFVRYFERFMAWFCGKATCGPILQTLALTGAAQLITNPVSASQFGQLSLIAPIANALMAPCFTVVCGVGLPLVLLVAFVPGVLPALQLLAHGCTLLCAVMGALAAVPGAAVPVYLDQAPSVLLAIGVPTALWVIWPRPSLVLIAAFAATAAMVVAVCAVTPLFTDDQIVMLDVGQGDAFLLRSEGRAVLIDTGNHDKQLLQGLARQGVRHLDAVAITHADDDHCGSLGALKGVIAVDRVVVAADMTMCQESKALSLLNTAATVSGGASNMVGLPAGSSFTVGNLVCRVIGPEHFTDNGGNADSLTLLVEADESGDGVPEWRGLFCGDAEKEQLAAYEDKGLVGDVDIYKVGHHGSRAAVDEATARVLRPEICLVSVGAHNRYGHPVASTLETLTDVGGHIWRTDECGDVTCYLSPQDIRVRTQR